MSLMHKKNGGNRPKIYQAHQILQRINIKCQVAANIEGDQLRLSRSKLENAEPIKTQQVLIDSLSDEGRKRSQQEARWEEAEEAE